MSTQINQRYLKEAKPDNFSAFIELIKLMEIDFNRLHLHVALHSLSIWAWSALQIALGDCENVYRVTMKKELKEIRYKLMER